MEDDQFKQDFSLERFLSFKSQNWVVLKGPLLTEDVSTFEIKILKSILIDQNAGGDSIYFEFGFCTPDYVGVTLAWDERVWSFGSGTSHFSFHKSSNHIGELLKINDIITITADRIKSQMTMKINENDYGIIFNNLQKNICFAVSIRGDLEIEILNFHKKLRILDLINQKKVIDLTFHFH